MTKTEIHTDLAPSAIGTYSQAIKVGHTIYCSGQIPLVPATMQLISDDIAEQVTQTIKNIANVCRAASGTLDDIVKLTVYVTDIAHAPIVNRVMGEFFSQPYPARVMIEVSALPKGAAVEIDVVMVQA